MYNSSQSIDTKTFNQFYTPKEIIDRKSVTEQPMDIFAKTLLKLGAKVAFGTLHGSVKVMHKVLDKTFPKVTLAQHECGAAFLGMGYQTISNENEIPVCFFSADRTTTHLITGVACAYSEKIPLFIVTGGDGDKEIGEPLSVVHDDVVKIFESVTIESCKVRSADQIESVTRHLYQLAVTTRLPVHLALSIN